MKCVAAPVCQAHMHVQSRPGIVGERFAHEGRDEAMARGKLLHHVLEAECAVAGVERLAVIEVDLELAAPAFVVARGHAEAHQPSVSDHLAHHRLRIRAIADRVDHRELVGVAREARGLALEQIELELGGAHRSEPERAEGGRCTFERASRRQDASRIGRIDGGETPGDGRIPRKLGERGGDRRDAHVRERAIDRTAGDARRKPREAVGETVRQIGGAESQAVLDGGREVFDGQIFAAGDAVHVAVIDPHGVHAAFAQFVEPLFERACHVPSLVNATTKTTKTRRNARRRKRSEKAEPRMYHGDAHVCANRHADGSTGMPCSRLRARSSIVRRPGYLTCRSARIASTTRVTWS